MNTTREKFEKMLVDYGMFPQQAHEVMDAAIPVCDSSVDDYKFTWDRPSDEYPEALYNVVFVTTIKDVALEYIKKNCPNAWFRMIFEM